MNRNSSNIIFRSEKHEQFFYSTLKKCRCKDEYHAALVYCLGIDQDTRTNAEQIYDFETGCVKTGCLQEGWQTSGSQNIIRMAFNLYNNGTPSVNDYKKTDDKLAECRRYTVEKLFCCGYAPYFWQAVKIRYPEYCGE